MWLPSLKALRPPKAYTQRVCDRRGGLFTSDPRGVVSVGRGGGQPWAVQDAREVGSRGCDARSTGRCDGAALGSPARIPAPSQAGLSLCFPASRLLGWSQRWYLSQRSGGWAQRRSWKCQQPRVELSPHGDGRPCCHGNRQIRTASHIGPFPGIFSCALSLGLLSRWRRDASELRATLQV